MSVQDPEWERYLGVDSRAADGLGRHFTPLGDPSRWGGNDTSVLPSGLYSGAGIEVGGQQLIRVQTQDPYARAWMISGTVYASDYMWSRDADKWQIALELTMGAGQATVIQRFDLRSLISLAAPWYLPTDNLNLNRPFVICGGIYGRAVSARAVHILKNGVKVIDPEPVTTNALIAPIAAGSGI